jgi:hypothetical protein
MTVSYDHGAHDPKLEAAQAFCAKHEWSGAGLVEGVLPNGDAVFVFNFPRANSRTNAEGLTFQEWFAATGRNDTASPYDLRAAWRAGEDPTEYRVSK